MIRVLESVSVLHLRLRGFKPRVAETSEGRVGGLVARGGGVLPPVVMLHGASSRGTHYQGVVRRLLPHVKQIVLPDFLGHGLSADRRDGLDTQTLMRGMREALASWLDEPALIYGNSLGGYGALWYAVHEPERVRGVLVTSPAGGALPDSRREELIRRFLVSDIQGAADLVDRIFHRPPRFRPLVSRVVRRQLSRPHMAALFRTVAKHDDFLPEQIAGLKMPVSLLWGQSERVLQPEQFAFFERNLGPNATIERPEAYGHAAYMEHPDDLAARLLRFAAGLD